MSYTCFDVSLEDKIAHIRLSRPEAYNTMVPEFWRELPEIVRTLDDAGEARATVSSAAGAPTCAARCSGSRRRSLASTARACPCSPRCRAAASAAAST